MGTSRRNRLGIVETATKHVFFGHYPDIVGALIELALLAVIRLGNPKSEHEQTEPRLFTVPYLKVDFHDIFSRVDLVVHHGEYC